MTPIEMPMNDEIQQVNGVSKSTNQETRRLSNNLAQATKVMIKKNWKIIYIKAVPAGIRMLCASITKIIEGKYIMVKSLEIQAYPRVNIWQVLYVK